MRITSINVMGDTGQEYTLTVAAPTGTAKCTCPAFTYGRRGSCKHMVFLLKALTHPGAAGPFAQATEGRQ